MLKKLHIDSSSMAFVRDHKMPFFGGICFAGNSLLTALGQFNHDPNIKVGGMELVVGSLSASLGGPKLFTATALTSAGVENIISGAHDIAAHGPNIQNILQTSFGVGWTVAPLVLFYGREIAEVVKESPLVRLSKTLLNDADKFARHSAQIASVIYNTVASAIGVKSGLTLHDGLASGDSHKTKSAMIGLAISALFMTGNAVVGLQSTADMKAIIAPRRSRSAPIRLLSME